MANLDSIKLFDSRVDVCTNEQVISLIHEYLAGDTLRHVITPNTEMIMLARRNQVFRNLLNDVDLAIPDGAGLVWAAKFLFKKKNIERVTGSDLIIPIAKIAADKQLPIVFINKKGGIDNASAKKAAEILKQRFPKLNVKSISLNPTDPMPQEIVEFQPAIMLVGLGAPEQDFWIETNCSKVSSIRLAIGVGGAFDFIAGVQKRAPKSWQKLNLEWFWRLLHQPNRIKRQLVIPQFMFFIILIKLGIMKNSALRA